MIVFIVLTMNFPLIVIGLVVWLSLPRLVSVSGARGHVFLDKGCRMVGVVLVGVGLLICLFS